MLLKFSLFLFLLHLLLLLKFVASSSPTEELHFTINGFTGTNLTLDGMATVSSDGLLILTNSTTEQNGHAFHPSPLCFCRNLSDGSISSFSTTFAFAIVPEFGILGGHGLAFVISPSKDFSKAQPASFLGLFNTSNNGHAANHVVAIELDTLLNVEFQDINNNHVGIDINGLWSKESHAAGYYAGDTGEFRNLTLISGKAMQVWVDYDSADAKLNVTLSPTNATGKPTTKPTKPLISFAINLSTVLLDRPMYVGFSASTGSMTSSHYVLGWSFAMGVDQAQAPPLDYSKLPAIPRTNLKHHGSRALGLWLGVASLVFVLLVTFVAFAAARWRSKYAELREDWEVEFGPHRFSYRDLFQATNGFGERELLGVGGFGRVDRGTLPNSGVQVAVKRVSHESRQGKGNHRHRRLRFRSFPLRGSLRAEAGGAIDRRPARGAIHIGGLGGRELAEGFDLRYDGCRIGRRVRKGGGRDGAEAGSDVLAPAPGGTAEHAAGGAVLGGPHAVPEAVAGLSRLHQPIIALRRRF